MMTLLCAVFSSAWGQTPKVTFDFSTNDVWQLPEGSTQKGTTSATFTNGNYTITLQAESSGYYYSSNQSDSYLMLGKTNATLTFPAFNFKVGKIAITGTSIASEKVKQNIFVGDEAVSDETTGAKNVTNEYTISSAYQAAGTIYVLKVLSNHNTQISKIEIYESDGSVSKLNPGLAADDITLTEGENKAVSITTKSDGALTLKSSDESIAKVTGSGTSFTITAVKAGTATITVNQAETTQYEEAEITFTVKVNAYIAPGEYATVSVPYTVDFTKTKDQFVIEDIANSLGTAIWTQGSTYGMTATTYLQLDGETAKTNHDGESWLVSPIIDLTGVSTASLAFSDNWNKYFTDYEKDFGVYVREAGGNWTKLNLTYEKPSGTFAGWRDEVVDLSSYAGKKIQVGYYYMGYASGAGTYEVKNFSVTAETTVVKQEAGLSYGEGNVTVTIGEAYTLPTLINPNNLAVTYSSSNTAVATIDETGKVTLTEKAGQTTIKATFEGNDNFKEGSASYLLVVKEKAVSGTEVYELVTDPSSLKADDRIIIVNEDNTYAISTTQNNNNRAATDVTLESDGTIKPSNLVEVITLEQGDGGWYFSTSSGYLYAPSSSGNQLKTQAATDEKALVSTISIADGIATVQFNQWAEGARTLLRFNPNSGNPIFNCYATTSTAGSAVRIYRNTVSPTPLTDPKLSYDEPTQYTATLGEPFTAPTLKNPHNVTVTYSSSNEKVATVDASTGTVTLVGAGETTITASSEKTNTYKAGSASYTLTVSEPEIIIEDNDDRFALVEDYTTLKAGDQIALVGVLNVEANEENGTEASTTYYGMGIKQNNNNREAVKVTYNTDKSISGNTALQTITLEGAAGEWLFNVGNGYLYAASSKSNWLRTEEVADDNAKATITAEDGILFQGENTRNQLRFNDFNILFSCYATSATTGSLAKIYRKVDQNVKKGDANGDGKVDISDVLTIVDYKLDRNPKIIMKNSDLNGDKIVDLTDALIIVDKFILFRE